MVFSKWWKPQLCKCNKKRRKIWWYHSQYELDTFNYLFTRGMILLYILITIRPLFYMTIGSGKLILPCNGTNILTFDRFEKLINEYKALKRVITNIQTSKNINAISHYYESYRTPRIKIFEDLLLLWERIDELYQQQKNKYLECYYRNRDEEFNSLKIFKWIILPYPIIILFLLYRNLLLFPEYKSKLQYSEYRKLWFEWIKIQAKIIFFTGFAIIPEYYLPKLVYFLDYWFFVESYLGM